MRKPFDSFRLPAPASVAAVRPWTVRFADVATVEMVHAPIPDGGVRR